MGSVKIVGRNDGWLQKPTTFEIHVKRQGNSLVVKKRYNDFFDLAEQLRPHLPDLPTMPPRSFVVRRLNPRFLEARQKQLSDLLEAAIALDPTISAPALKSFLGLDKGLSDEWTDCSTDLEQSATSDDSLVFNIDNDKNSSDTWTDSDLEHSADSSATSVFECAHCFESSQTFADRRSLICHMKFVHGWEDCQMDFVHGWEVLSGTDPQPQLIDSCSSEDRRSIDRNRQGCGIDPIMWDCEGPFQRGSIGGSM